MGDEWRKIMARINTCIVHEKHRRAHAIQYIQTYIHAVLCHYLAVKAVPFHVPPFLAWIIGTTVMPDLMRAAKLGSLPLSSRIEKSRERPFAPNVSAATILPLSTSVNHMQSTKSFTVR